MRPSYVLANGVRSSVQCLPFCACACRMAPSHIFATCASFSQHARPRRHIHRSRHMDLINNELMRLSLATSTKFLCTAIELESSISISILFNSAAGDHQAPSFHTPREIYRHNAGKISSPAAIVFSTSARSVLSNLTICIASDVGVDTNPCHAAARSMLLSLYIALHTTSSPQGVSLVSRREGKRPGACSRSSDHWRLPYVSSHWLRRIDCFCMDRSMCTAALRVLLSCSVRVSPCTDELHTMARTPDSVCCQMYAVMPS